MRGAPKLVLLALLRSASTGRNAEGRVCIAQCAEVCAVRGFARIFASGIALSTRILRGAPNLMLVALIRSVQCSALPKIFNHIVQCTATKLLAGAYGILCSAPSKTAQRRVSAKRGGYISDSPVVN